MPVLSHLFIFIKKILNWKSCMKGWLKRDAIKRGTNNKIQKIYLERFWRQMNVCFKRWHENLTFYYYFNKYLNFSPQKFFRSSWYVELRFSSTLKCVASCVSERKTQPYVIWLNNTPLCKLSIGKNWHLRQEIKTIQWQHCMSFLSI